MLVFPSLIEAVMEAAIGRDISHTALIGAALIAVVMFLQYTLPAKQAARQL